MIDAKDSAFAARVAERRLPLRESVKDVLDAAIDDGALICVVAATGSSPEEGVTGT